MEMGADSAGVAGYDSVIRKDEKVFMRNGVLFGFTTSFRMEQLLRYKLEMPNKTSNISDYEYLCTDFIDSVIKCFKDNQFAIDKNGEIKGGVFLVGFNGNIYKIESDFQVGLINTNYNACGCGESFAMGALKIMEDYPTITPKKKIEKALAVAESFSAGVSEPFIVKSILNNN